MARRCGFRMQLPANDPVPGEKVMTFKELFLPDTIFFAGKTQGEKELKDPLEVGK